MRSYPCKVIGITYEGRLPYILANVREGDVLELLPEPKNQYDDKAVAVFHEGYKIGYIPANKRWVSKSIAEGDEHEVIAQELVTDDDSNPTAISITITIIEDGREDDAIETQRVYRDVKLPAKRSESNGNWFKVLLAIAAGAILVSQASKPTKTVPVAAQEKGICDSLSAGQAQEIVKTWTEAGVIVDHRAGVVVVSDKRWEKLKSNMKVSIGLGEFCDDNPTSRGVLIIRGDMDNAKLGSVIDGNYFH
jgi:hypothetical protein